MWCEFIIVFLLKCIIILTPIGFFERSIIVCRSYIRYKHITYFDKELFDRNFFISLVYPGFVFLWISRRIPEDMIIYFDGIIIWAVISTFISLLDFIFNIIIWNVIKKENKL